MNLIDQALKYNIMSSIEEFPAQPPPQPKPQSTEKPSGSAMKNKDSIYPVGNGGFGDINNQDQQTPEIVLEDPMLQTRNTLNPCFGSGSRKILNNNELRELRDPWGDGLRMSAGFPYSLMAVPPPSLPSQSSEQQAWINNGPFPVRIDNQMTYFNGSQANSKGQQLYDSSGRILLNYGGDPASVCCPSSESSILSPRERNAKARTTRERLKLLNRREYENDRLKKAKDREDKLRREEEEIEKKKLFALKSEVLKLEEKRKQQEWQTYRRQERLLRKKEQMSRSERRERSRSCRRSRSRSRTVDPQRRRSRSRTRAHTRQIEKTSTARSRHVQRRSRSASFRRESFPTNSSPKRRIQVRRDRSSIDRTLMKIASGKERSPFKEPSTERYVRYKDSRISEVSRGKSKPRIERRIEQERKSSYSSRRGDYQESPGRERHWTYPRGRMRSRSSGSRFR